MKLTYPNSKATDQTDNYHGTLVPDPYRWLEDVDSPETLDWIQHQNELTFGFLEQTPAREQLRKRLTELWDYPKAQAPIKCGGRYFQLATPVCKIRMCSSCLTVSAPSRVDTSSIYIRNAIEQPENKPAGNSTI